MAEDDILRNAPCSDVWRFSCFHTHSINLCVLINLLSAYIIYSNKINGDGIICKNISFRVDLDVYEKANITLNLSGATIDKADEPCGVRRFHVTHGESKE